MSKSPKVPKHPRKMTTEEAIDLLFHPKVLEHLKNVKDAKPKPSVKKA